MKAETRELVRQKFNGKCAFCGCELKTMLIWDIDPIQMVVTDTGDLKCVNDHIENLYPACKSCGSIRLKSSESVGGIWQKKKMTIEDFRKDIEQSFKFLRSGGITQNSYGRAIRFKLIFETNNPVVFYFESVAKNSKNETPLTNHEDPRRKYQRSSENKERKN